MPDGVEYIYLTTVLLYSATGSAVAVQYNNACTTIVVLYNITGSVV